MDIQQDFPFQGLYLVYRKDDSYGVIHPFAERAEQDMEINLAFVKAEAEREANKAATGEPCTWCDELAEDHAKLPHPSGEPCMSPGCAVKSD